MTSADGDDIADLVRRRRVHFELEREYVDGELDGPAAGFLLRLFALHDKCAHVVPDCPCCRRLAGELRRLATTALSDVSLDADVQVGLLPPALYESRALPGRDEVALGVRVRPRSRGSQPGGARDDRDGLSRRLKRLGLEG
jgi:hypothetical protein